MKNTIANVEGILTNFSQEDFHYQLYNYKVGHKVAWIEENDGCFWLKDIFDMARGWSLPVADLRRAARTISKKCGVECYALPFSYRKTKSRLGF